MCRCFKKLDLCVGTASERIFGNDYVYPIYDLYYYPMGNKWLIHCSRYFGMLGLHFINRTFCGNIYHDILMEKMLRVEDPEDVVKE